MLLDFGKSKRHPSYYLVMDILGPSLYDLLKATAKREFSEKTVMLIGLQMVILNHLLNFIDTNT